MPSYTLGLLGGFTPAVRWWWRLPKGDYAEQIAFAVPESTEDHTFDAEAQQPIWIRSWELTKKTARQVWVRQMTHHRLIIIASSLMPP